ncbi:DNA-methyltransferase [Desulfonema magnum]|uniref:Methyltransferase n=1 Tax=Desulfonema magnum TaxID=45655 RepID=A0A975BIL1_9BACT|nr:DNA methyltransferase [Desulfonema magnum]QTA85765.1 SAM-dependent methyltransferase [Desulfonema magnum]
MEQYNDKIILGDSLQVLKKVRDNSVDLVITSPPYFQQRDYGNGNSGIGNESTEKEYLDNLLAVFFESVRVTKTTGTIVYNIGDKYSQGGLRLIPYRFAIKATESQKVFLVNDIKWIKLNPTPRQDKRKLIQSTEPFFVFAKSKEYHFDLSNYLKHLDDLNRSRNSRPSDKLGKKYFELIDESDLSENEKKNARRELRRAIEAVHAGEISSFRMKIRGIHKLAYGGQAGGRNNQIVNNGFTIIRIKGDRLKRDVIESPVEITKDNRHPAVYPLYIVQELIRLLSKPGDIVLDPFNGSGTTSLAAKNLDRHYIGIDINPEYVELANNRLKKSNYQQELFI